MNWVSTDPLRVAYLKPNRQSTGISCKCICVAHPPFSLVAVLSSCKRQHKYQRRRAGGLVCPAPNPKTRSL